jgi:hypothetical protein
MFDPSCNPQQKIVSLADGDDGCLQWPVVFLYPEYGQTDFIEAYHENSTLVRLNFTEKFLILVFFKLFGSS